MTTLQTICVLASVVLAFVMVVLLLRRSYMIRLMIVQSAHDNLRSVLRKLEQRLHEAEGRERSMKAELARCRGQGTEEVLSAPIPKEAVRPMSKVAAPSAKKAPARSVHSSSPSSTRRHSGGITHDDGISPVTAALVVHALSDTHSYGDYSDSYTDTCSSSNYTDTCGYSDSCGGGCDSGGCGGD